LVLAPDVWVGCDGKIGPHQSWSPQPFLTVNFGPPDHFCIMATPPGPF